MQWAGISIKTSRQQEGNVSTLEKMSFSSVFYKKKSQGSLMNEGGWLDGQIMCSTLTSLEPWNSSSM